MQEIWRDIIGYEGRYQVSDLGNVKSLFRHKKILKPAKDKDGYLKVVLYKDGERKNFFVHRLVAETFIPNPENKPEVNHDDGNKENCCVSNLYWATKSENMQHAFKNGLHKIIKGSEHVLSRKVNQYDLQGNLIKTWDCIMDIERELGIKTSNICACCKGKRKTLHKYIWQYKDIS